MKVPETMKRRIEEKGSRTQKGKDDLVKGDGWQNISYYNEVIDDSISWFYIVFDTFDLFYK